MDGGLAKWEPLRYMQYMHALHVAFGRSPPAVCMFCAEESTYCMAHTVVTGGSEFVQRRSAHPTPVKWKVSASS